MADFVVTILVLCVFGVAQGQTTPDDSLANRVVLLERQGAEQGRLIASLLERLDSQDKQIQAQTRLLATQQLRLDSQDTHFQAQTRIIETKWQSMDKQDVLLQDQSQTLEQHRQLLRQNAGQSEKIWFLVRRQNVRIKSQERALQNLRSTIDLKASSESSMKDGNNPTASGNPTDTTHTQNQVRRSNGDGATWMGQQLNSKRSARIVSEDAHDKRLVMAPEGPVAFHAVIDKGEVPNIGINQNIVFDVVLENLGGGYHNQHGIFIAPANGVYIFSVSVLSFIDAHPEFRADLKKDGVVLARAFGHGDNHRNDQGSVTIVTNLTQGNEVWVSLQGPTGDSIYGGRYTSFMGYLLYPL